MDVLLEALQFQLYLEILPVSILIVMDVLLEAKEGEVLHLVTCVSILIVMDVLLEDVRQVKNTSTRKGFNPYCNGCTSRRFVNLFGTIALMEFQSLL